MRITSEILQQEFIGLRAKVVKSSHSNYIGISGTVINETCNTLTILNKGKEKKIVKKTAIFHFIMPNKKILEIDGNVIIGRPEDRIKYRIRRRW